jgi:hypothetical protein
VLEKPLEQVIAADVEALITDRAEESQRLEFKREVNLSRESDKKELAKDVSGMANAAGGRILFGIEEGGADGHRPTAARILPLTDRTLIERVDSILADSVTPPVRTRIRPIDVEGGFVMMIDVPQSDYHVHMVGAYKESRYYIRTEKSVVPMPEVEVRRAYERIGRLRDQGEARVKELIASETIGHRRFTTLMIPLGGAQPDFDVMAFNDISMWLTGLPRKLADSGNVQITVHQVRPSRYGVEAYLPSGTSSQDAARVLKLFRDGTLHIGTSASPIVEGDNHLFESRLLFDLYNACLWMPLICRRAKIRGPVRAVVSIPPSSTHQFAGISDIPEDSVVLAGHRHPIVLQTEWTPSHDLLDGIRVLQTLFDELWQCMGQQRCHEFFVGTARLQPRIERLLGLSV